MHIRHNWTSLFLGLVFQCWVIGWQQMKDLSDNSLHHSGTVAKILVPGLDCQYPLRLISFSTGTVAKILVHVCLVLPIWSSLGFDDVFTFSYVLYSHVCLILPIWSSPGWGGGSMSPYCCSQIYNIFGYKSSSVLTRWLWYNKSAKNYIQLIFQWGHV